MNNSFICFLKLGKEGVSFRVRSCYYYSPLALGSRGVEPLSSKIDRMLLFLLIWHDDDGPQTDRRTTPLMRRNSTDMDYGVLGPQYNEKEEYRSMHQRNHTVVTQELQQW